VIRRLRPLETAEELAIKATHPFVDTHDTRDIHQLDQASSILRKRKENGPRNAKKIESQKCLYCPII
jgi:hypothetical protein